MARVYNITVDVAHRVAQYNGKPYVVVPVAMMVEGVHNNNQGQCYYPAPVIERSTPAWEGVPITVHHPKKNGVYVSAQEAPDVVVGHIAGARWNGKLMAEAWIDSSKANDIDESVMTAILSNSQLEVSTGHGGEDREAQGRFGNEAYNIEIESIIPDHLALLPGDKGACSWADGCGIRANQKGDNMSKFKRTKGVMFKGFKMDQVTTNTDGEVLDTDGKTIPEVVYDEWLKVNEMSHQNIRSQLQGQIDTMDTANKYHFVQDVFDNYFVYAKMDEGPTSSGRSLFKQGYSIAANDSVEFVGGAVEVIEKTTYEKVNSKTVNEEESEMTKEKCCPEKVKALIANENNSFVEGDAEFLETLTEVQLDKIIQNAEVKTVEKIVEKEVKPKADKEEPKTSPTTEEYVNAAPPEIKGMLNAGLEMHRKTKAALVNRIVANEANKFPKERLEAMELDELENIVAFFPVVENVSGGVNFTGNAAQVNNITEAQEEPMETPVMKFNDK